MRTLLALLLDRQWGSSEQAAPVPLRELVLSLSLVLDCRNAAPAAQSAQLQKALSFLPVR